jgi:hypothetical protein
VAPHGSMDADGQEHRTRDKQENRRNAWKEERECASRERYHHEYEAISHVRRSFAFQDAQPAAELLRGFCLLAFAHSQGHPVGVARLTGGAAIPQPMPTPMNKVRAFPIVWLTSAGSGI